MAIQLHEVSPFGDYFLSFFRFFIGGQKETGTGKEEDKAGISEFKKDVLLPHSPGKYACISPVAHEGGLS